MLKTDGRRSLRQRTSCRKLELVAFVLCKGGRQELKKREPDVRELCIDGIVERFRGSRRYRRYSTG